MSAIKTVGDVFGHKKATDQLAAGAPAALEAAVPPPASQAAQTPDEAALRTAKQIGAQGSAAGGASARSAAATMLTGAGGVAPSLLNLGKASAAAGALGTNTKLGA